MIAQQNGAVFTASPHGGDQRGANGSDRTPLTPWHVAPVSAEQARPSLHARTGENRKPQLDQPLLIIASGGRGREIATYAKATFIETLGATPGNVRIVAFDSAADPITCLESRSGRVVELEAGREFFLLGRVPLAGIKRNLKGHTELCDRLGSALLRISRASIEGGAAQERCQGLLALMWSAKTVDAILGNAVRQLAQRSASIEGELDQQGGMNVVVVGSTAGGQGSGSIFDLTYLARERLAALGDLGESSRVIGMFVLPGALVGVQGPNLLPNTHAFFLELDALQQGAGFEARYPGGLHIQSMERPFDYVYVLDGVDEHGKAWPNQEEVCAMGARALTMLFGGSVGAREIFNTINEQGVLQGSSASGRGAYLSTAGQAVLRFPAVQILERCARRQARASLATLLTAPTAQEIAELSIQQFAPTAVDRLRNNQDGAPHQAQLHAPAALQKSPAEDIPAQARTLTAHYMQRRVFGDCFTEIGHVGAAFQAETRARLEEYLRRLLHSGRFRLAQTWLQNVQTQLDRELSGLSTEIANLAQAVERGQVAVDSASSNLDQAAGSFIIWRQSQVRSSLAVYIDEAASLAQLRIDQRVRQLAGECLRTAQQWAAEKTLLVNAVIRNMEQAQIALTSTADELTRSVAAQREIVLADDDLIEQLYHSYCGPAESDGQALLGAGGDIFHWAQLHPNALAEAACDIARRSFAPLRELSVEDILRLRWDDRSAQQWIERLRGLAAGGWNLDRSLLPGGGAQLAAFLTLGAPDAAASIFADSGVTLVSTHDRERIIALSTVYGASFDTLKPARAWQYAYDASLSRTPLHILPQFLRTNENHATHAFVLGVVFGMVFNQATWFYYRPADGLAQPVRLGQGIDNVLSDFAGHANLHEEIMERVEQRIAVEGVAKALEMLDAYVNTASGGDETTQKLRRAARDYAEELRRSRRIVKSEG
jgi:hypothetical protein